MQTAANNNLVLTDFSSLKRFADSQTAISYGGFYQLIRSSLIKGVQKEQVFRELGDRLIVLAEHAHTFREMDALEHISQMLVGLQLPRRYETVGQYYRALCIHRFGLGDVEQAARLLGRIAENAPPQYRARAMLSMGSMSVRTGHNQTALSLYCDAARFVALSGLYDPYATVHTQKMFAVINSEDGNHRDALTLLENLFPRAHHMRLSQAHVYCDYMNSLAVELCEVGRLEEAKNVSQIVLASPFAPAYPEWRETSNEIALRGRRASRSVVAFSQPASESESQITSEAGNLLHLAVPQRSDSASPQGSVATRTKQRARIVNLLEWKNEMTERKSILQDRQTRLKELKKLPTEDKIAEIWGRLGDEDVDDDLLCEALLILEDYPPEENQGA